MKARNYLSARPVRAAFASLALALLAGCNLEVITPGKGKVVTASGNFSCPAGENCALRVNDTAFEETFIAVPAEGYAFSHWHRGDGYLCGGAREDCALSTRGFAGTALMSFLDSNETFRLKPVFVKFNHSYWTRVVADIRRGSHRGDNFLYALQPNTAHCDPGQLSEQARMRSLTAVNEVRALHQLAPVSYATVHDMEVAEASLVQSANDYLSHNPSPGDRCYSEQARRGASTANLLRGQQSDPASDVFNWTNDNNNSPAALAAAGHRRWILYPGLRQVSYGKVGAASALKVFGFNSTPAAVPANLEYVAMPHGMYPHVLVSRGARPTPWSLSLVTDNRFDYFRNAEVTVHKRRNNGKPGKALKVHSRHSDTNNYGTPNFLSWMVDDWDYDTEYLVRISNIRLPGGGTKKIQYPVIVVRNGL